MSQQPPPSLPPELLRAVDATRAEFNAAWQAGQRPEIDCFLPRVVEMALPVLLARLIRAEMEWRCRKGEQPSTEEYARTYPDHSGELDSWLQAAQASARRLPNEADDPTLSQPAPADPRPALAGQPPKAASTGPIFLGEYELLKLLKRGGMGEVWKARHRLLNQLVALKRLFPGGRLDDAHSRARILQETSIVGRLDHPNLIGAHYAGENEGTFYLVMKLVEGQDLECLVQEQGQLPVSEACALMRQAALGLQYLLENRLVHGNIKPANLMRQPDGTLKIIDFGLARLLREGPAEPLTDDNQMMGTLDYLAPEQIDGAATVDIRADLYSLGTTFFHLLTGRAPFADKQEMLAKLNAHRSQPAPDVRTLHPEVPPALAELVVRLQAKRPEDRLQTPGEVAVALAPFTADSGTPAPLPQPGPRFPQIPTRRRQFLWTFGVAAAGCLAVVLGWFLSGAFQNGTSIEPNLKPGADGIRSASQVLEVLRWEAGLVERVATIGLPRGLLGVTAFRPRLGDRLDHIEAELWELGQAYLIAYRPDGREELCWPPEENQPPPAAIVPRYPVKGREVDYDLNDGTGLQVFVLAASRRPLVAYREWKVARGKAPWNKERLPEELAEVVWRDRGLGLDGWTRENPFLPGGTPINRGKDVDKLAVGPLERLKRWWKEQEAIEVVAVLALTVGPR